MKIIHISDLHWGGGDEQKNGMIKMVDHLLTIASPDTLIFVSGDVVDGRNRGEWVGALKALQPLSVAYRGRFFIVPGNHDTSNSRGLTYDDNAADRARFYINGLTNMFISKSGLRIHKLNGMKIIGVDTNIGNSDDWVAPLARGEIGKRQLAALEVELQDEIPTFIIMHHKPQSVDVFHTLEDRDDFLKLINRRDHVKAVFFGHMHEWSVHDVGTIRYFESDNTTCSYRYRVIDTDTLEYITVEF